MAAHQRPFMYEITDNIDILFFDFFVAFVWSAVIDYRILHVCWFFSNFNAWLDGIDEIWIIFFGLI